MCMLLLLWQTHSTFYVSLGLTKPPMLPCSPLLFPCRLWPAAMPSHLLFHVAALPRQRLCLFEAQLLAPALSLFWDHLVQGRPLLPGSALLEMAMAAAHMQAASPAQPAAAATLMLSGCSIPAPVALSASPAAMRLQLEMRLKEGSFAVRGMQSRATHLAGRTGQCWQPASGAAVANAVPAGAKPAPSAQLAGLLMGAAEPAQLTFQTASLAVDPKLHTDGYCSHPAVVDSCLHLGASLAQLSATTTDTIRVPVGVEAFTAGQQFKPHHAELHAACQLVSMPVGPGPAITSYSLQQAPAAPAAVSISKLEARPIKLPAASKLRLFPALAAPAAAKQQAPAADAAEPPLLYQVRWEADSRAGQASTAAGSSSASCQQHPWHWPLARAAVVRPPSSRSFQQTAAAAAEMLCGCWPACSPGCSRRCAAAQPAPASASPPMAQCTLPAAWRPRPPAWRQQLPGACCVWQPQRRLKPSGQQLTSTAWRLTASWQRERRRTCLARSCGTAWRCAPCCCHPWQTGRCLRAQRHPLRCQGGCLSPAA